ncbi:superoxide dismutase [Fe] [Thiotrichales bacterium 19S9-12]|nr:superoxide dismutase [Fe] [Thiotrichales bacterium 19S9-11]MCF6811046.1 superoxide dismutase [Fe] [Thiotrichales bacterium 19S9-12]
MSFELPQLPYEKNALAPYISEETLEYHYGKHHQTYVTNLNNLILGTDFESKSLEEIIMQSSGGLFNNAAQIWNHTFYWNCLSPNKTEPSAALSQKIDDAFGSLEQFKEQFSKAAATNFGAGWTWLVENNEGQLEIFNTSNADLPMKHQKKALLTIDVWEHAYYIDYRNQRPKYISEFFNVVNWDFVSSNLTA